ncbi:MAG: PD40 domain-containing protein [Rhodothermales bacterium]|nr:PD40 domain-containing protein [Rhodothermales bacterium]MBO6781444.1 PD40 domain-containing protein [Rhodothermales bacterium]
MLRPPNLLRSFAALVLTLALAAPAAGQYGYHFGRNKIQYDNFEWRVLETEHFDIFYYPEMLELARQGAYFAEEAYEEMQNRFNFSLNNRVPMIFYSSNLHFKQTNVTPGFIPDGVGGFFEFLKGRVVIPANGNIERFRRVIRHELVHVFTYNKVLRVMRDHRRLPDRFLPLWFTEGIAEYWSGEPDHQHDMIMRDAVYSNYLVPVETMYRINGSFVMYKQGEAICEFIAQKYGPEKLLDILESVWVDTDFKIVLETALRVPYKQFAEDWHAWIQERYVPEAGEIGLSTVVADAVTGIGFSSKPETYRKQDGRRMVYFVGNRTGYSNLYEVEVDTAWTPVAEPRMLIRGERNDVFEAFHLFESRMDVSGDGRLAFVTKSGSQDVVHIYDLERDELDVTLRFEDRVSVSTPSWSPEGDRFVFSSIDESGYSDLFVYSFADDSVVPVTDDAYDDLDPAWSPDGRFIAFTSDRTSLGKEKGAYNLFTYDFETGRVEYVTFGDQKDFSPSWSPDGKSILYTSAVRDSTGRYSAQDMWVADVSGQIGAPPAVASLAPVDDTEPLSTRRLDRLTRFSGAAFDPVWTDEDRVLFTSFEGLQFTVRSMPLSDRLAEPLETREVDLSQPGLSWTYGSLTGDDALRTPYKKRFKLDLAQGSVSQSPVLGTLGGAVLVFSDMLGDDYLNLMVFNTAQTQRDFLRSLSFQLSRTQLHRRTNFGYGGYRFSGLRYDITDPDAPTGFPRFYETVYGGFGAISHPISKFRRLDLGTSLNWSRKEIDIRNIDREALLLSNSISLVHDNALYYYNGPIQGWRARVTAAYTTDVLYSNVSYYSLLADLRTYIRLGRHMTFASWGMARMNRGREARLYYMGGSWDLRGFRLFSVRGQKQWFTSHELRFPILTQPSVTFPALAALGVVNLKGSLFFDAAHAWNQDYNLKQPEIFAGETLGSAGLGLRLNMFGGFVFRYDIGHRYRDGFTRIDKRWFKQFFFGWNF